MNLKQYSKILKKEKKSQKLLFFIVLTIISLGFWAIKPTQTAACTLDMDCTLEGCGPGCSCVLTPCYCEAPLCVQKKADGATCSEPRECQSARCEGGRCGSALPAGNLGGACTTNSNCTGTGCTPSGTCACAGWLCVLTAAGRAGDLGFACLPGEICNIGDCATPGRCDCYEGSCRVTPVHGNLGAPCAPGNQCTGIGCGAAGACSCCGGTCQIGACVTGPSMTPVEFTSPIGQVSPSALIGKIIKTFLGIIGAIALLMFIYGGQMWLTSGGSPETIKKSQSIIVWAIIGLAVIFASYACLDFILSLLSG